MQIIGWMNDWTDALKYELNGLMDAQLIGWMEKLIKKWTKVFLIHI